MKFVSSVDRCYSGWIPGFRKWELRAFNEHGHLICEVTEWEDNNYIKFVKFLNKLRKECGYDLTDDQRKYIKSEPFLSRDYIPYIQKHHLVQIANMCNYSEQFLDDIRSKTEEERHKFAYDVGLETYELDEAIRSYFG